MPGRIFINYRRGDEPGFAGRMFDRLEQAFTVDQLFMDVDHIGPGQDFVRVLEDEIGKCDVLLAIIGKGWIDARDEAGLRRLESANDFVRIEIESAMKHGKRLIPVLVNDAQMPRGEDLPDSLAPLARRNAVRLTHERFKSDAQGLIKILETALAEVEAARAAKTGEERRAAELALKRKQDEEAARAAEAEQRAQQRAQQQSAQGLSPAEIVKAEELANWDFIKAANDSTELRNHLARFPAGVTERYARVLLEDVVWREMGISSDMTQIHAFLAEFPEGRHSREASAKVLELRKQQDNEKVMAEIERREVAAWTVVSASENLSDYKEFIRQWPSGKFAAAAGKKPKAINQPKHSGSRSAASVVAVFAAVGLIGGLMVGAESATNVELLGSSFKISDVLLSMLFTVLICAFSMGVSWLKAIGLIAFVGIVQPVMHVAGGQLLLPALFDHGVVGLAVFGVLTSIPLLVAAFSCAPSARSWKRILIALIISAATSAIAFLTDANANMYLPMTLAAALSWTLFAAYLGYMLQPYSQLN